MSATASQDISAELERLRRELEATKAEAQRLRAKPWAGFLGALKVAELENQARGIRLRIAWLEGRPT
jgi:hypothetical protein